MRAEAFALGALERWQAERGIEVFRSTTGRMVDEVSRGLESLSEKLAAGDSPVEQRGAVAVATLAAQLEGATGRAEAQARAVAAAIATAAVEVAPVVPTATAAPRR